MKAMMESWYHCWIFQVMCLSSRRQLWVEPSRARSCSTTKTLPKKRVSNFTPNLFPFSSEHLTEMRSVSHLALLSDMGHMAIDKCLAARQMDHTHIWLKYKISFFSHQIYFSDCTRLLYIVRWLDYSHYGLILRSKMAPLLC